MNDLKEADTIVIDRSALGNLKSGIKEFHLHGFSDASEKAYCCAIYLHAVTEDSHKVTLLISKQE